MYNRNTGLCLVMLWRQWGTQWQGKKYLRYRKIPKISPGAYIFQRAFLRGLFLEALIFGGAYLQREICVSKSIRLTLSIIRSKFTIFALFYFVFEDNFRSTSPQGAYTWRGDLTEGFLRYEFGGLVFGGSYTWRGLFSGFYSILMRFPRMKHGIKII